MTDPETPTPEPMPSSWAADEQDTVRAAGKSRRTFVIAGIVVALILVAGVIALSQRSSGPEERAWPAAAGGRPAGLGKTGDTADQVTPTAKPGVYVWNDFDGWHLWVVNGDRVKGVRGTITSSDEISKADLSARGAGTVRTKGTTTTFDLKGEGPLAGIDFEPGFYSKRIEITLADGNGPLAPSLVTLGGSNPVKALPLVIDKAVVEPEK